MARNKMTKQRSTKKTSWLSPKNTHETLEKEFRSFPSKIIAQYQKTVVLLRTQETKLGSALNKAQAQQKATQKKLLVLLNTQSPANKKQLNAIKQAHKLLEKTIKDIATKMKQVKENLDALAGKQKKFSAISKEILKLEKSWKNTPAKAKPAKSAVKRKKTTPTKWPTTNPSESKPAPDQEEVLTPADDTAEWV